MRIRISAIIVFGAIVYLASFGRNAVALEIVAMAGAPNSQGSPSVTSYASIANFRANSSFLTTNRSSAQSSSCDFAITANGTMYYIGGDATAVGNKTIFSWPSVANWSTDSNVSNLGSRNNAAAMSGMAIYQNELYILEGSMDLVGTKNLMKWSTIASWVNGDVGTYVGSRGLSAGIGFDISLDGYVCYLDTSGTSPNTATKGTLYTWPTISDFFNNIGVSDNGGEFNFFTGSPNKIAGLAVPEPSTYVLAALACITLVVARHRRIIRIV